MRLFLNQHQQVDLILPRKLPQDLFIYPVQLSQPASFSFFEGPLLAAVLQSSGENCI